jgi:hypothetical protein
MAFSVIIHISGEDPVLGEIDELPGGGDTSVLVHNPRRRDGKDVAYLAANVISAIWPINQIAFIEVLPSESEDKIIGFVRE